MHIFFVYRSYELGPKHVFKHILGCPELFSGLRTRRNKKVTAIFLKMVGDSGPLWEFFWNHGFYDFPQNLLKCDFDKVQRRSV